MSEYQRYEFMTIDRPLTREQLDAVNALSSHIEASSTHAIIEYHWSSFGHDPIKILHKFFDGFLYWANWGSPRLALRFPHRILPANLIDDYDFDDFVTFTKHADYDILDIHLSEVEAPDTWTEYDLGSLIAIRDELMEGDMRSLYIAWLACQAIIGNWSYDEDEEEQDEAESYDEDEEVIRGPVVLPDLGKLTAAQQALAELLHVPQELLDAVAHYSSASVPSTADDFATWIELLPQGRRNDYLMRLAYNEPGLSRLLVKELRELGRGKTNGAPSTGKRVTYATLLAESKEIEARLKREKEEEERQARLRHLQDVHDQKDDYWRRVGLAAARGNATGYDEALRLLLDLRSAADQFEEVAEFQARYYNWVQPHLRRPALLKRLQDHKFPPPVI